MTPKETILEQIHHRETRPVPFDLGFDKAMEKRLDDHYGGTDWKDELNPYMFKVRAVDFLKRDMLDGGARGRDMYGSLWRLDRRPWHQEEPALPSPSFSGYTFPDADAFFLPEEKERSIAACEENGHRFLVAGMGWGLFESSWGLRGFENALMDSVAEPDFYEEMLDRLTRIFLDSLDYTLDLPVDAVMFGDDWGDQRGVIIGPDRWRKFLKPRWAKIYQAVHERGKIVMSHCCGSVVDIMPDIIEIGLDVIESVQPKARGMNPYELKGKWGDKITFWGGLCSQQLIPFGKPDEIRDEVRHLCRDMGREGGYILGPAKALQPETPIPNALAVIEAFTHQG